MRRLGVPLLVVLLVLPACGSASHRSQGPPRLSVVKSQVRPGPGIGSGAAVLIGTLNAERVASYACYWVTTAPGRDVAMVLPWGYSARASDLAVLDGNGSVVVKPGERISVTGAMWRQGISPCRPRIVAFSGHPESVG